MQVLPTYDLERTSREPLSPGIYACPVPRIGRLVCSHEC